MKVVSMGFPKTMFPFRSLSQRLNLEYDEMDELMDQIFRDIFEAEPSEDVPATDVLPVAA